MDKAVSALKPPHCPVDAATLPAIERFPTPGVRTIEELTKPLWNVPAQRQIKLLFYRVTSRLVLLLLTGADRLNEAKLAGVLGTAEYRPAEAKKIRETLGADPCSLGGVGVDQLEIIADHLLKNGQGLTTGANENDWHVQNVCIERDIKVTRWEDLRAVGAGEPCPVTGAPLEMRPAIEVGHIFKLGTKYSESLNAFILNGQGQQQPAIMGCYVTESASLEPSRRSSNNTMTIRESGGRYRSRRVPSASPPWTLRLDALVSNWPKLFTGS